MFFMPASVEAGGEGRAREGHERRGGGTNGAAECVPYHARVSSRARTALLIFAGSTVVALFFATQAYLNPDLRSVVPWKHAIIVNLAYYWLYGLAVPLVAAIARRYPFESRKWQRPL